jgi:hypothetical protein
VRRGGLESLEQVEDRQPDDVCECAEKKDEDKDAEK